MEVSLQKIFEIWLNGGWIMIPLFLLSFLLYTQAFRLALSIIHTKLPSDEEFAWREEVGKHQKKLRVKSRKSFATLKRTLGRLNTCVSDSMKSVSPNWRLLNNS